MRFPYFNRPCPAGLVPYTIRSGYTLSRIARVYNTDIKDIINGNPGINPDFLTIGQQICVPLKAQIYPSCPTRNYYVVMSGDTIESISGYYNITPLQLLYSNYGIDPNDLYADQILCIPVAPSPVSIYVFVRQRQLNVYRNGRIYRTYIIGLKNAAYLIPRGTFTVVSKQVDPGIELGARWIGLSEVGVGIHGTNTPQFINVMTTVNNVIMSNRDISELFNLVPVGTAVTIL